MKQEIQLNGSHIRSIGAYLRKQQTFTKRRLTNRMVGSHGHSESLLFNVHYMKFSS